MTRRIFLVALLGLASARAAAQENGFAPAGTNGVEFTSSDVAFDLNEAAASDNAHHEGLPGSGGGCLDCAGPGGAPCCGEVCYFGGPCGPACDWIPTDHNCQLCGPPCLWTDGAVRFGGWGVIADGSPTKTGEFQDLDSSPFFDVETIRSDGVRTWDIVMSGFDNEANNAHVRYFGPSMSANVEFQRYLRRLDHDPLTGLDLAPGQAPPMGTPEDPGLGNVISEDLNVGEDYAIRVQELDARFKGRLTNNLHWRMNVWGLRKFGERQSNATAHCFNVLAPAPPGATGNVCHVLSQRQTIDWTTLEIQPVVEARFDAITIEYSHTLRTFGQDDGLVDRQYTRFGFSPASAALGPPFVYAFVPENTTNIDRIRVNAQLTEANQLYGSVYYGETENNFRETHRQFTGFDVRVINRSFDRMTLTGYGNMHDEQNELPPFFLDAPPFGPTPTPPATQSYDELSLRHPVDRNLTRLGLKGSWQPFGNSYTLASNYGAWNGLSLVSGYEFGLLDRDHATFPTALGPFTQEDTKWHRIEFGPTTRWSPLVSTHLRYKVYFVEDPLIGVREFNGRFNTNQPELENHIELGGTWTPADDFMVMGQIGLVNRRHESEFADFNENNYPVILTAWYAPTERLSLAAGYGYFSNLIDQDITLGFTVPRVPVPPVRTETTRWDYDGENHQVSLNAHYAWRPDVRLVGGYEWNWGQNVFSVPPSPADADWSLLPFLSDVEVTTHRATAGVDWQPYNRLTTYFRYQLFAYDDAAANLDDGTAHMFLAGASLVH